MKKAYIILLSLATLSLGTMAQQKKDKVELVGKVSDNSEILLRWAPNSPSLWHLANQYGYTIERHLIVENGELLKVRKETRLNEKPIMPAKESEWEKKMDQDDYVAISAQAIFGETFELTDNYRGDIPQMLNKAKETGNRYSFALYAADMSLDAAKLSGLYYKDEQVYKGQKYLYKVYANIPPEIMQADTGYFYIGLDDYKPLPAIRNVKAQFDDKSVLISWNGELLSKIYTAFWVERSDNDGKSFSKITESPLVNTRQKEQSMPGMIFLMDSLPQNGKEYFYRVKGIDAFGETGPPSDTVSGIGLNAFHYAPGIVSHQVTGRGEVVLEWHFPEEGANMLKSFDVLRKTSTKGALQEVATGLSPGHRTFSDPSPLSSAYYVVQANDRHGRSTQSFPYFVQTEDSIPPMPPTGLKGTIDTLGHVYLSWDNNTESDLHGYKLFKANHLSEQFIEAGGAIIQANSYVDTIRLKDLTEKIYYQVRALDNRFNPSGFSEILELKKPDLIPPVPPVFKKIKGDSLGVWLEWETSGSEDVANHLLYRKAGDEVEWSLIKVFGKDYVAKNYLDKSVKHRQNYAYTMLAVDDDGLESKPAAPLGITWISPAPYPLVDKLFYKINPDKKSLNISWVYGQESIDKYIIYKSVNGQPLNLYKSVPEGQTELLEKVGPDDKTIEYRVAVMFKNGDRTKISKPLIVKL